MKIYFSILISISVNFLYIFMCSPLKSMMRKGTQMISFRLELSAFLS